MQLLTTTTQASPLLPAGYDIAWAVLAVAGVAALFAALVVWFRDERRGGAKPLSLAVIVLLPVLGPTAYLVSRRGAAREAQTGA